MYFRRWILVLLTISFIFPWPIVTGSKASSQLPHYFIAIHNEPFHRQPDEGASGDFLRRQALETLIQMTDYASYRGIRLTLMFAPQWADLLMEDKHSHLVEKWKSQGHEISTHHHGIRHGNWDGYTNYSKETAYRQRLQQKLISNNPHWAQKPEAWLGTLQDAMNEWRKICPDIHTGCMNAEFDKNEIPQGITIDTSAGFLNNGRVGVRKKGDGSNPDIGINEYLLQGNLQDHEIQWLSHFLPGTHPQILPDLYATLLSMPSDQVYGLVFHSSPAEFPLFKQIMDFLHRWDPVATKSQTLQSIVSYQLLPKKNLPPPFLGQKESEAFDPPPLGFHPANISHPQYHENGYLHAHELGINMSREGLYAFWPLVQPDLNSDQYHFQLYDTQWYSIPSNIQIIGNISVQPAGSSFKRQKEGSWLPIDIPAYQAFVRAVVERYDGDGFQDMPGLTNPIKIWQIDNEPNLFASGLSDYAHYHRITYEAIKEADPEALVLMAGVAGGPRGYLESFRKFYLPVLKELGGQYIDIFDFHWYGNAFGDYRMMDSASGENVVQTIRQILIECGYKNDLPLWITEMGTYSGVLGNPPRWESYQSEKEQAIDLIRRCFYTWANGIDQILMAWGLMEGFKYDYGYFDYTGFIYDGFGPLDEGLGEKKLAYFTLQFIGQYFKGLKAKDLEWVRSDDHFSIVRWITPQGKEKYIVWRNDEPDVLSPDLNLDFPYAEGKDLRVTEMVAQAIKGKGLETKVFSSLFKQNDLSAKDSVNQTIPVGRIPLLIEVN
jgi:hypothetical protein